MRNAFGESSPPQDTVQDAAQALGYCRTTSGRPLAAARVVWLPQEPTGIAWLDRRLPPPPAAETVTDRRGRFRVAVPDTPALCLVTSAGGLGALVPEAFPDTPLQITATPLGATVRVDGKPLEVAGLRLATPDAVPRRLPGSLEGLTALPAGSYLALLESPAAELSVRVLSGSETSIDPGSLQDEDRRVPALPQAPEGHRWVALGSARWPVRLDDGSAEPDAGSAAAAGWHRPLAPTELEAVLRGPRGDLWWSTRWPTNTQRPTHTQRHTQRDREPPVGPGSWTAVRLVDGDGAPCPEAWLLSVLPTPAGEIRMLSSARTDADGHANAVRADEPGSGGPQQLVAWAPGRAPRAVPFEARTDAGDSPVEIVLPAGVTRRLRVLDADGAPLAGARCTLEDPDHPALLRRIRRSDARGVATFPGLDPDTSYTGFVEHPQHLTRSVALRGGAADEVLVALDAGLSVLGRVFEADGHPAAGVAVELRDSGRERGGLPRRTVTGSDGSFRFQGLREGLFTLFTSRQVGSTTWSGIRRGVQSGTENEWRLELRSEDPLPPGAGRDRR